MDGMWRTPTLVQVNEDRTDVVMLVARELWGLDPKSGRLRWFADATNSQQAYTSVISQGDRVFTFSGAGAGSVALDIEGREGRTDTRPAWTSSASATYGTPVRHQSKLYVASRGILAVLDANTGDRLEQIRLSNFKETGNARFGSLDYQLIASRSVPSGPFLPKIERNRIGSGVKKLKTQCHLLTLATVRTSPSFSFETSAKSVIFVGRDYRAENGTACPESFTIGI